MYSDVELVVARYLESAGWLRRVQALHPVVYQKGPKVNAGPETRSHPLPNIGREAHTYLHHIIQRYDNLASTTIFLQGNPFDHCPDILNKLSGLEPGCLFRHFSDHLLVEDSTGNPSHPGVPFAEFYRELLGNSVPDYLVCRTAACFSADAATIRSRPLEFYEKALRLTTENELGAHAMERLWQFIFHRLPESEGIVTACDSGFFSNLRFLIVSLRRFCTHPVAVFDLGLTESQKSWLNKFSDLIILPMPKYDKWIEPIRHEPWWQTWLKPFYIQAAPFDRVLWIDADCVVTGPLDEAFECLNRTPLLTVDGTPADTRNRPRLYRHLRLTSTQSADAVSVNAGVVGVCKIRDRALLDTWTWGIQWAAQQPSLRNLVAYADQGILHWAIARTDTAEAIQGNTRWACPCRPGTEWISQSRTGSQGLLSAICDGHPEASIVHWYGVNKLTAILLEELSDQFDTPLWVRRQ